MAKTTEKMSEYRLGRYVEEARSAAGYVDGFGVVGCELNRRDLWAVYIRQSTREQAENDRMVEYLLSCARIAKDKGLVVPNEYIIYDSVTSEHLGRPGIKWLRTELIPQRRIAGVIIPTVGRLSCDDHHRQTFEKECSYYGVNFVYGDAPSGQDVWSMFARSGMSYANLVRVKTNRDNALGGNIARVMTGKVPPGKAPYGYKYRSKAEIDSRGRRRILEAWWELNEIDENEELIWGSPAWVVQIIFHWVGFENRTQYWCATKLNTLKGDHQSLFRPLYGDSWIPKMIGEVCARVCYTGKGVYNMNKRVPNPDKPLKDLTDEIPRTILRPKPETEWHYFNLPPLTTKELWDSANTILRDRGRGRGKQGKKVEALLRGRIYCPVCSKPMSVKRKPSGEVYYYCRSHLNRLNASPCPYRRFISAKWDDDIWSEVCTKLKDDFWLDRQTTSVLNRNKSIDKLIEQQESKISNHMKKIWRVEEGFNGGLYSLEEAKRKKESYQQAIDAANKEINRLKSEIRGFTKSEVEVLRDELRLLRNKNIQEATFNEKVDLVARLGLNVFPSEDLKTRKISCHLPLENKPGEKEQVGSVKEVFSRPYRSQTCDTLIKRYKRFVPERKGK